MLKQQNNKNDSLYLYIHIYMYAKECLNYHTTALISHASKVMLKILQARLQQYVNQWEESRGEGKNNNNKKKKQYMNWEFPDAQAGFRKGRGTRDQIANIHWIIERAREFEKKNLLLLHWLH